MLKKTVLLFILLLVFVLNADVPKVINYQGILTDPITKDPVSDATYSIKFSIYTLSVGGDLKWTETQNVTTSKGFFSVLLGSLTPIDYSVFDGVDRYLGIKVFYIG